jgi:deazaflavin-dependent oxidoreductase (nitroreductase family)
MAQGEGYTVARKYRLGVVRKMVNRMVARRLRRGKMGGSMFLLTTLGRKSGLERTTPVNLAELDGERYLVSPYGTVGWVHNIRAAPMAELSRGGEVEEIAVSEVDGTEAAPVLKKYLQEVSVVRAFFDVDKDDPVEEFAKEAAAHPVFRIS